MDHKEVYKHYPQVVSISGDRCLAEDGSEVLIDEAELLQKTFEWEKGNEIRNERDRLLSQTDWWAVKDRTMSQAQKDYRQALRDITLQPEFPHNVTWPTKP